MLGLQERDPGLDPALVLDILGLHDALVIAQEPRGRQYRLVAHPRGLQKVVVQIVPTLRQIRAVGLGAVRVVRELVELELLEVLYHLHVDARAGLVLALLVLDLELLEVADEARVEVDRPTGMLRPGGFGAQGGPGGRPLGGLLLALVDEEGRARDFLEDESLLELGGLGLGLGGVGGFREGLDVLVVQVPGQREPLRGQLLQSQL